MDVFDIKFWAGTEASLQAYVAALKRVANDGTLTKADVYQATPAEEVRPPRLFSKHGDIGVISIKGSLNNSDSWINPFIGAVGYPEIREALVHAASNPEVKTIVLDINSGGGSVSGMFDTADLIKTVDSKVKPIYTFADGMIASAAYALGVSARDVSIGRTAEAGSIGVVATHVDLSKMYADMGVNVTLIRSGKYKALGHSSEPLSALGKEILQEQVDKLAGMFNEHVAAARGTSAALVESKMGQGRVFIGQDAMDVGLVDRLANFDKFMSKVQGGIDSRKQSPKYGANQEEGTPLKTALTEQAVAALAAGAVAAVAAEKPAVAAEVVAEKPAVAAEVVAEVVVAAEDKPAAEDKGVVALLQSQLADAQAKVVDLSVELKSSKDAVEAGKAASDKMRPIVRASVSNMRIALGGSAAGVEALADEVLLAEHANVSAQFEKKFKAGGVAAVSSSAEADNKGKDAAVDPLRQARLAATRNTQPK